MTGATSISSLLCRRSRTRRTGPTGSKSLLSHKTELEDKLGKRLRRADRSAILSSVVAVTSVEVSANIHKDGAAKFFSDNRFLDLLTGETIGGLPEAGKRRVAERLVGECLRFVTEDAERVSRR